MLSKDAEIQPLGVGNRTAMRRNGRNGTSLKEDGARAGGRCLAAIVFARRRVCVIRAEAEKAG